MIWRWDLPCHRSLRRCIELHPEYRPKNRSSKDRQWRIGGASPFVLQWCRTQGRSIPL